MKKISKILTLLITIAVISGCAFRSHEVNLEPQVSTSGQNIGQGKSIAINIIDERESTDFGRRNAGLYGDAAKITSTQDVANIVKEKLSDAYTQKGFVIDANAPTKIDVYLRSLEYESSAGIFSMGIHAKSSAKVNAVNSSSTYSEMYRQENEKRTFFSATANQNRALINQNATELLNKIVNDENLNAFLVR